MQQTEKVCAVSTGVVLVTSGPGATNAITGIATAYMDSIPMVVISGQVPTAVIGSDAFQEVDMVGITRPRAIRAHFYFFRVFIRYLNIRISNIFWNIDNNWTWATCSRNIKCLFHRLGNIVNIFN
jgi:hypothetical protein